MKVCVTSQGNTIDSQVDPRFGRCSYFAIVDTDSMELEAVENSQVTAAGGAGVQSAKTVSEKGTEIVITGSVGPNAFTTLNAADIKIVTGASGTVKEAVEKFKNGELKTTQAPDAASKSGLK